MYHHHQSNKENSGFHAPAGTLTSSSPAVDEGKVHFAVQDAADGRKFKVMLRPRDMGKLRVHKIRRTLSQTTGYDLDSIQLFLNDAPLRDDLTGAAFGLGPSTVLVMRAGPAPGLGVSPPPPPPPREPSSELSYVAQHATQYSTSPPPPPPYAGSPDPHHFILRDSALKNAQPYPTPQQSSNNKFSRSTTSPAASRYSFTMQHEEADTTVQRRQSARSHSASHDRGTPIREKGGRLPSSSPMHHAQTTRLTPSRSPDAPHTHRASSVSSYSRTPPRTSASSASPGYLEKYYANMTREATPRTNNRRKPNATSTPISSAAKLSEAPHPAPVTTTTADAPFTTTTTSNERALYTEFASSADAAVPNVADTDADDVSGEDDDDDDDFGVSADDVYKAHIAELQECNRRLQNQVTQARDEASLAQRECTKLRRALSEMAAAASGQESADRLSVMAMQLSEERERAQQLEKSNDVLTRQLKSEAHHRKKLEALLDAETGPLRVIARIRPLVLTERPNKSEGSIQTPSEGSVVLSTPGIGSRTFNINRCFGPDAGNDAVWSDLRGPVRAALDKGNLCVVAYGQTSSGKTHTLFGGGGDEEGMVTRTIEEVFHQLSSCSATEVEYNVSCTVLEVYMDTVRDLTSGNKVELRSLPDGVAAVGATRQQLLSTPHAYEVLAALSGRRPRAHVVVTLRVAMRSAFGGAPRSHDICFVDLAGSERVGRGAPPRDKVAETQSVNKSLSALGDVLGALRRNQQQHSHSLERSTILAMATANNSSSIAATTSTFVPYRNSKLTLLLQDVLSSELSRVVVLGCLAPAAHGTANFNESTATMNYVGRLAASALQQKK